LNEFINLDDKNEFQKLIQFQILKNINNNNNNKDYIQIFFFPIKKDNIFTRETNKFIKLL